MLTLTILLDDEARAAEDRFTQFEANLNNIYLLELRRINVTYGTFEDAIGRLVQTYLDTEWEQMETALSAVAKNARTASGLSLSVFDREDVRIALSDHLMNARTHLFSQVHNMTQRALTQARHQLQRSRLEIDALARVQDVSRQRAIIDFLLNRQGLNLIERDRLGRNYRSAYMIRLIWRQALLFAANEMVLIAASFDGTRSLVVRKDDEKSGKSEVKMTISIAGEPDMSTYSDAIDQYFHPNSTAWLAKE